MTAEEEAFQRRFDVSRETTDRLETYRQLLVRWNPKINLVSKSTLTDACSRHIVDSAQIFGLAPELFNCILLKNQLIVVAEFEWELLFPFRDLLAPAGKVRQQAAQSLMCPGQERRWARPKI